MYACDLTYLHEKSMDKEAYRYRLVSIHANQKWICTEAYRIYSI